jgi:tetratricopeptide (TPR) repeat protein
VEPSIQTLKAKAAGSPDDVLLQIQVAYALDSRGDEQGAIEHYDRAYSLGVPADQRAEFLLGYGSTLKNVGRLGFSEEVLTTAIRENPENSALKAFLALTYHAQERSGKALSILLRTLLSISSPESDLQVYAPALQSYADELAGSGLES